MSSVLIPAVASQCLPRCPTQTRTLVYIFGMNKYVLQLHTHLGLYGRKCPQVQAWKPGFQTAHALSAHHLLPTEQQLHKGGDGAYFT